MDPSAIRNFRDFLLLYNGMSEICFTRCIDNVNSRTLDKNEADCVEDCAQKFIYYNNKLMKNFVEAQSAIVNKRVQEVEAEEKKRSQNQALQKSSQEVATAS